MDLETAIEVLDGLVGKTLGYYRPKNSSGKPGLVAVDSIDYYALRTCRLVCRIQGWPCTTLIKDLDEVKPSERVKEANRVIEGATEEELKVVLT